MERRWRARKAIRRRFVSGIEDSDFGLLQLPAQVNQIVRIEPAQPTPDAVPEPVRPFLRNAS
jgi:hypothetical protein